VLDPAVQLPVVDILLVADYSRDTSIMAPTPFTRTTSSEVTPPLLPKEANELPWRSHSQSSRYCSLDVLYQVKLD